MSVSVEAQALDFSAQVRVTQLYAHPSAADEPMSSPLDLEYKFPLAGDAAVVAFEARIEPGGRVLHGVVKEKAQAAREFNKARKAGKQTLLLESSSAEHAGDFEVKIGQLRPGQSLHVTVTYVQTLALEGRSATRLVVPAVVAPRYEPAAYLGWQPPEGAEPVHAEVQGSFDFIKQMTAAAAPPKSEPVPEPKPVRVCGCRSEPGPGPSSCSSFCRVVQPPLLSISATFMMPDVIDDVTSPSHPELMRREIQPPGEGEGAQAKSGRATANLHLDASCNGRATLERDFVLLVHQSFQPARAVLEVDPATGDQCVQLSFCPESFDAELDASSLQVEMLFLIDQSGSMGGSSIAAVRETLQLFLRSLPVHCTFNLIGFGSSYRPLFPQSVPYSSETLAKATAHVSALDANMGGTEIYDPLFWCLANRPADPAYPRQIFVLTDGQVSNAAQVCALATKYCAEDESATRVFTFGIGSGVDRNLVTGMARAGRGEAEFIMSTSGAARAELNSKVMRQLIRSLQPSLTQVKVDWAALGGGQPASVAASASASASASVAGQQGQGQGWVQYPQTIPAIFPPARSLLYCSGLRLALPSTAPAPGGPDHVVHVRVSALSNRRSVEGQPAGVLEWLVPLNLSRVQRGAFLHKLAARARIGELQAGPSSPQSRAEILRLALANSLASSATSFLIVDADPVRAAEEAELARKAAFEARVREPGAEREVREDAPAVDLPAFQPPASCRPSASSRNMMAAPSLSKSIVARRRSSGPQQQQQSLAASASASSGSYSCSNDESDGSAFDEEEDEDDQDSFAPAAGAAPAPGLHPEVEVVHRMMSSSVDRTLNRSERIQDISHGSAVSFAKKKGGAGGGLFGAMSRFFGGSKAPDSAAASPAPVPTARPSSALKTSNKKECEPSSSSSSFPAPPPPAPSAAVAPLSMSAPPPPSAPGGARKSGGGAISGPLGRDDAFQRLVQLQQADGSWALDDAFVALLRAHASLLSDASQRAWVESPRAHLDALVALASKLSLQPEALASLLALWLFEHAHPSRKDEVRMMTGKARNNLRSKLAVPLDSIPSLMQQIVA